MLFEFGFYSSLLLITFSQGIIYTILLFVKGLKTGNKSNHWLSTFVLLCSLFIAPWMLGFAGWYDNQPYRDILFYAPFQQLLFIGPVIYFYTQSLLNPVFSFNKKQFLHLIPGILYLLYILSLWIYDKLILKSYYFYADGMDKDFEDWYQNLGLISMIIYFVLSLRYYTIYKKMIFQVVSFADRILFKWIKTYLIAFLIMLLLPVVFDCFAYFYPNLSSYTGTWWFFLFYSLVMYYIAITGYSNPVNATIPFKLSDSNNHQIFLLSENNLLDEEESAITIDYEVISDTNAFAIDFWMNQIEAIIEKEELYTNPDLALFDIAKKLNTNNSIISKAINQGFKMNFNDYINKHRIEKIKRAFDQGEHKKTTLLGIAFDSGFNSKATFNRAFKKNTGFSPKEYLEKL